MILAVIGINLFTITGCSQKISGSVTESKETSTGQEATTSAATPASSNNNQQQAEEQPPRVTREAAPVYFKDRK